MKKLIYSLSIFLILIGLSGCSIYQPLPPSELNKRNKIGIVALSGKYMTMHLIGTTAFNNELQKKDISEWKLEQYLQTVTENKLKEKSNISIVSINYNSDKLKEKAKLTTFANDFAGYTPDKIKPELKNIANKYNLNYLLVIVPSQMVEFYGVELFKRQFLESMKSSKLTVSYSFKLFDVKDMDKITQFYIDGMTSINNDIWDNGEKLISSKEMLLLETLTKEQIANSIEKPLKKIGLIKE